MTGIGRPDWNILVDRRMAVGFMDDRGSHDLGSQTTEMNTGPAFVSPKPDVGVLDCPS